MKEPRRSYMNRAKSRCNHQEKQWRAVVAATNGLCLKCRSPGWMTRDHIVPIAHGGDHGIYNIQPLCYDCNRSKRTSAGDYRTPIDMASIMKALYQVDCCGADYDTSSLYLPML